MDSVVLAPGIQAIVRDWLDANHVLVTSGNECVLIDTGCSAHAERTLALLRDSRVLGARSLDRIVNTHCHSDHMGGNAAIARAFQAPITVPLDAVLIIDRWDTRELLLDYADQEADRFSYASTIASGDTLEIGGIEWRALAAPGHDMSALVFYAPEHRVPCYRDYNEAFFGLAPHALSEMITGELLRAGAIAQRDADVIPR